MNNLNLQDRIRKYLDGAMSVPELAAFETDLKHDPVLKRALIVYSINNYKAPPPAALENQNLAKEIFNALKPPLSPNLPLLFRLNMWLQPTANKLLTLGVGLGIVALAYFLWPKPEPLHSIILANFEQAKCKDIAAETLSQRQIFEQGSDIYCGRETDPSVLGELQKLSEQTEVFCMADYYIAHWMLKNEKYSNAVIAFEQCLAAREIIESNPETEESRNALLLNTLLARLGATGDKSRALKDLEQLRQTAKVGSPVDKKRQALLEALSGSEE